MEPKCSLIQSCYSSTELGIMLSCKFDGSILMAPGAIIYWQKSGYPKFRGSGSHEENHQQIWIQQIQVLPCLDFPNIKGPFSRDHGSISNSGSKILKFTSWCRFLLWLGKFPHMLLVYRKLIYKFQKFLLLSISSQIQICRWS